MFLSTNGGATWIPLMQDFRSARGLTSRPRAPIIIICLPGPGRRCLAKGIAPITPRRPQRPDPVPPFLPRLLRDNSNPNYQHHQRRPHQHANSNAGGAGLNLSTRMRVQTGDNVGIGGFIITGTAPKHVLLRAIGPSLTQFGVPDALADPVLELHGPADSPRSRTTTGETIPRRRLRSMATGIPPTNDLESAIDATLIPEPIPPS